MKETIKRNIEKKQNDVTTGKAKETELKLGVRRLREQLKRDPNRTGETQYFIGIDLGDKRSNFCFLDSGKEILSEGTLGTTAKEFAAYLGSLGRSRIALEVGTHSAWVADLLESLGHEVVVANPRRMESIHKNKRKNDKVDARTLARLVRADPELLYPIRHRGVEARKDLVVLRARDGLVSGRTKLINAVRGLVKSMGGRIAASSAEAFPKAALQCIPEEMLSSLLPLVEVIQCMSSQIKAYDREVHRLAKVEHPDTALLQQVGGVGDLTSLAYVLTLETPERFCRSRDVGAYVGLVPRQDDSGESSKQLRITKTGDGMLRRLLVSSAQYILGPFGEDCDLRRFGLKLAERGGKNAKKRAAVAVARKLSVLLHRLWVTSEVYDPLHTTRLAEMVEA